MFSRRETNRRGFTLIELLVVIAIIGVLAALTAAGVFSWVNGQNSRNTKTTIESVYKTLRSHWNEVIADAKKETIPDSSLSQITTFAGGDPDRARVLWIKTRLVEAFPVRYAEVQAANPYANFPLAFIPAGKRRYMATYQTALSGKVPPNVSVANDPAAESAAESAILLLQALAVKRGGVNLNYDDLGPGTKVITSDGMRALVDGFGNPIRFNRFTTGNPNLSTWAPAAGDPLDPKGTLINATWQNTVSIGAAKNSANFQAWYHGFPSSGAYYTIPVLVSSGPDGLSGLNASAAAPFDSLSITNAGQAADDVYSFTIAGGP